ncbi:MAG: hypothetical protein AAF184_07940 [Pseudomonadota bacterium]
MSASTSCQALINPRGRSKFQKCGVYPGSNLGVGQLVSATQRAIKSTRFEPTSIGNVRTWSVVSLHIEHSCATSSDCTVTVIDGLYRNQDHLFTAHTTAQEITQDGQTWVDRLLDGPACAKGTSTHSYCTENTLFALTPIAHIDHRGTVQEVGLSRGSHQRLPSAMHEAVAQAVMSTRFLPAHDAVGERIASVLPLLSMIGSTEAPSGPLCMTPPLTGSRLPDLDCQIPQSGEDGRAITQQRVSWIRLPEQNSEADDPRPPPEENETSWSVCSALRHSVAMEANCGIPALPSHGAETYLYTMQAPLGIKAPSYMKLYCVLSVGDTGRVNGRECWEGTLSTTNGELGPNRSLFWRLSRKLDAMQFSPAQVGRKHKSVVVQVQLAAECDGDFEPCKLKMWLHHGPTETEFADEYLAPQGVFSATGESWIKRAMSEVMCVARTGKRSNCTEFDELRSLKATVDAKGKVSTLSIATGTATFPLSEAVSDSMVFLPAQIGGRTVASKTTYLVSVTPQEDAQQSSQSRESQ